MAEFRHCRSWAGPGFLLILWVLWLRCWFSFCPGHGEILQTDLASHFQVQGKTPPASVPVPSAVILRLSLMGPAQVTRTSRNQSQGTGNRMLIGLGCRDLPQDPWILKWQPRALPGWMGFLQGRAVTPSTAYRKTHLEKETTVKREGKVQSSTGATCHMGSLEDWKGISCPCGLWMLKGYRKDLGISMWLERKEPREMEEGQGGKGSQGMDQGRP